MSTAARALELPEELKGLHARMILNNCVGNVSDAVAFEKLDRDDARLLSLISKQIESHVHTLVLSESAEEFAKVKYDTFNVYRQLSEAAIRIITALVKPAIVQDLTRESFKAVFGIFKQYGRSLLSKDEIGEVEFLLSTIQRAFSLCQKVLSYHGSPDNVERDHELASDFNISAIWSLMHFDCLRLILTRGIIVSDDVKQEILNGCRFTVMAYAAVREALSLRADEPPEPVDVTWDEEDRELAAQSTKERESMLRGW